MGVRTATENYNRKQTKTGDEKRRYSVATPREYTINGETKTHWTSVGSAFEGPKGWTIMLDSLPLNGKLFISTAENTN